MGKIVGIAEFKANCTRLLRELEQDGEPITVTKRGKPVAVLGPARKQQSRPSSIIGMLKNAAYRFDADPGEPACDPEDWEALR